MKEIYITMKRVISLRPRCLIKLLVMYSNLKMGLHNYTVRLMEYFQPGIKGFCP